MYLQALLENQAIGTDGTGVIAVQPKAENCTDALYCYNTNELSCTITGVKG